MHYIIHHLSLLSQFMCFVFFVFTTYELLIYHLLFCLCYIRLRFFSFLKSLPILLFFLFLPLLVSFLPSSSRLPPDNPRGLSSGPAEGGGGRWGRRLGVVLPSHLRARLRHTGIVRRAPSLLHRGGNCHHGDQDHQNHPANGDYWNANRWIFGNHDNDSQDDGLQVLRML